MNTNDDMPTSDIPRLVESVIAKDLNLEYERVISPSRLINTVIGSLCFFSSVLALSQGTTPTDFVIGAVAAAGFLRVVVGPITQVQLTHASSVRFEQWLTEEDAKDDTENNDA